MDRDDVIAALRGLPALAPRPDAVEVEPLGGLTNRVFRVSGAGAPFVLRLPGAGTEAYIDRAVEAHNARAAARAGVTPEILHVDPATGVLATRHVEGVTMTPAGFANHPGAPGRAAAALRDLHRSGETFRFRFELFAMIDDYLGVLARLGAALPEGYHAVVAEAGPARAALAARPAPLVPCHCDPLCENFIDTGVRMWLVDWEYSGMNDPLWDLGDLSVEAGFTPSQDRELLEAYFGAAPAAAAVGRVVIYKAMCDLLWTLWGLIQHANANPADDFWAYATARFARCRTLMASPDYARSVAVVSAGDG